MKHKSEEYSVIKILFCFFLKKKETNEKNKKILFRKIS